MRLIVFQLSHAIISVFKGCKKGKQEKRGKIQNWHEESFFMEFDLVFFLPKKPALSCLTH